MEFQEIEIAAFFFEGTVTFLKRSEALSGSYFGGPTDLAISPAIEGPKSIHRVLTLSHRHIPGMSDRYGFAIPLAYGICFSGCSLVYKADSDNMITIKELSPNQGQVDWPYPCYPDLLPYVPLEISRQEAAQYEDFSLLFHQGAPEYHPEKLVALLPPPASIGISLWGHQGDMMEVQIVFQYDFRSKIVTAEAQCD